MGCTQLADNLTTRYSKLEILYGLEEGRQRQRATGHRAQCVSGPHTEGGGGGGEESGCGRSLN